ncbi:hypothetical protein LNK15_08340 [Jeotgalicoccus huakuii]|nr:hypothetical protein [Jeotgalicoccus huakuii]
MEASKIKEMLDDLDSLPYKKVLFNGSWGIGKTKHILEAVKENEHYIYISLFGKKEINDVYEEIYYQIVSKFRGNTEKLLNIAGDLKYSQFGFSISVPIVKDVLKKNTKKFRGK